MKKKAIEKIPYLGLKKTSRKKGVKYIGVTAVKIIAREKHLFLEVYRNRKDSLTEPLVRVVLTKKDFGTYRPDRDEWSRQRVRSNYYTGIIWEEAGWTYDTEQVRNTLLSEDDLKRIKNFTKVKIWNEARWWEMIDRMQQDIVQAEMFEREKRKRERRQQALDERAKNTPELPEEELLDMVDERIFHREHYLFYKKRGAWAEVCCSKCGGVTEARWKAGISYESQFQRHIEEPVKDKLGTCPMCGARGVYKCQGKMRPSFEKSVYLYMGTKYKETGMVIRYIEFSKEWQLEQICAEDGVRMYSALEKLSGIEIARAYFEPGKKMQMDFHKHDPYAGRDFRDDCNLYGLNSIQVRAAAMLPQTYGQMEGTMFQYSALKEYMAAVGEGSPVDYLDRYQQTPQIEMLMKMGLLPIVKELVRCHYGILQNDRADRLDAFLGIKKDRVKFLVQHGGDLDVLRILQTERRLDQTWTEEQIEKLAEIEADTQKINQTLEITSIQKVLNRIEKYAGVSFGTGCSSAQARLKHTADIYFDYLSMRQTLGYNLQNTVYQQPRNLEDAHNRMIAESNKAKADERLKEVAEKFPLIRKEYRKHRKRYFYEDETFLIRPARSAEEIVMEGRLLHHCVGGNNYLEKHNKGQSIILFLRYQSEPETPYITVEIDGERVLQWYGEHDSKPDKDNIQHWIDCYTTRLRCQRLGVFERAEDDVMQQLLAYA